MESANKVMVAMVERLPLQNWSYMYTQSSIHTDTIPTEQQQKRGQRKNLTCLVLLQETCRIQTEYGCVQGVHQKYISVVKLQYRQGLRFTLPPRRLIQLKILEK